MVCDIVSPTHHSAYDTCGLLQAYETKAGTHPDGVIFFSEHGTRLFHEDTAASCRMVDGDVIDVMLHQAGD